MRPILAALALAAAFASPSAHAQEATYSVPYLTPETALKAAQGALKSCRDAGFQIAVVVVDRAGIIQAALRDRYAGPHTVSTAQGKAWTAVSFRSATLDMAASLKSGEVPSGIGRLPGVVVVGGGRMIEAGGALVGAIGVSGAPQSTSDDACAKAGIEAVAGDLF